MCAWCKLKLLHIRRQNLFRVRIIGRTGTRSHTACNVTVWRWTRSTSLVVITSTIDQTRRIRTAKYDTTVFENVVWRVRVSNSGTSFGWEGAFDVFISGLVDADQISMKAGQSENGPDAEKTNGTFQHADRRFAYSIDKVFVFSNCKKERKERTVVNRPDRKRSINRFLT